MCISYYIMHVKYRVSTWINSLIDKSLFWKSWGQDEGKLIKFQCILQSMTVPLQALSAVSQRSCFKEQCGLIVLTSQLKSFAKFEKSWISLGWAWHPLRPRRHLSGGYITSPSLPLPLVSVPDWEDNYWDLCCRLERGRWWLFPSSLGVLGCPWLRQASDKCQAHVQMPDDINSLHSQL